MDQSLIIADKGNLMPLPSVFEKDVNAKFINRLEKLKFDAIPAWGKMNAPQMLAHLNVAYDLAFHRTDVNYNFLQKILFRLIVKPIVTNEKAYKKNSPTGKAFIIADSRDFEKEKANLIANINETQNRGPTYFEGLVSPSFGKLTSIEWNNMLYKHLEHHFQQFGI